MESMSVIARLPRDSWFTIAITTVIIDSSNDIPTIGVQNGNEIH